MPMTSDQYPIEYYYPGGFGATSQNCMFTWKATDETFGRTPIYENQRVCGNGCNNLRITANYTRCSAAAKNGTYIPPNVGDRFTLSECCGPGDGPIKYALLGGEFPPSLYLNIDTGKLCGFIDGIEKIAPKRLSVPPNFRFNESNYLSFAVGGLAARFLVRAFDSGNTGHYDDRYLTMNIRTDWSARRDRFVLNIDNQFYIDGRPVSNKEYLLGMKRKGYYPGPGC